MDCRIGITTKPADRKQYWEGKHPTLSNWRILKRDLTRKQAQAEEKRLSLLHGCVAHAGGGGNVSPRARWSVYYFEF